MRIEEARVGTRVYNRTDRFRRGRIVEVMKTRIKVQWLDGDIETYDRAHVQFLEKIR